MAEWEPAAEGGKAGVVLRGGRVIDPESGFDAVADVAIGAGRVMEIGTALPAAAAEVDAAGLVVTAGFVDLRSHVNDLAGLRLQALDGVTTALELEAGASPVAATAHRRPPGRLAIRTYPVPQIHSSIPLASMF
jgi:N-acyl-D-glutamate deacylase